MIMIFFIIVIMKKINIKIIIKINENNIKNINNNINKIKKKNNNNHKKDSEKELNKKNERKKENNNKEKVNKRIKEVNNKYFQLIDKKGTYKKVNITDNSHNKNKNTKNRKDNKTPEINNGKIKKLKEITKIDKIHDNLVLDAITKERNTLGSIGSSSLVDTFNNVSQQTNITNFMVNNFNYNVNISFDNIKSTKRTYSHENTKDITQNEQTLKNNNTFSINTIKKFSNNINIIDNTINNYIKSNNEGNNNYLFNRFNYNIKNKNNKIKNNNPNKIKKNLKDIKINKLFNDSDNCVKKTYNEFLSKSMEIIIYLK